MHIADQCFSNFGVALIFPHNSVYAGLFDDLILRLSASGLDQKLANDMAWDLQRSDSQQLLDSTKSKSFSMAEVEERKLNLADTEGMFLLMAIGYIMAGSVLFSEIVGGCARSCRAFIRRGSVVDDRRSSNFSVSQLQPSEPKTFTEKLKRGIRRRLRSKPKIEVEDPREPETSLGSEEPIAEVNAINPEGTGLKGPTSFCTLKRIMLMRKLRKSKKEQQTATVEEAKDDEEKRLNNNHVEADAVPSGSITIENEKVNHTGDEASLAGSGYSETIIIQEETEADVNLLSASDRENNPSKEFGEVVWTGKRKTWARIFTFWNVVYWI